MCYPVYYNVMGQFVRFWWAQIGYMDVDYCKKVSAKSTYVECGNLLKISHAMN